MNHTKMTPGQAPDEFFYITDSCRERLDTSTPLVVPRIGSARIFYCKPCRQITNVFEEPISKGGTSVSPIFKIDGGHLC